MLEYKPLTLWNGQADVDMRTTMTKRGVSLRITMHGSEWKMEAINSRNGLSKTIDAGLRDTPEQITTMISSMNTASRQFGVEWLGDASGIAS